MTTQDHINEINEKAEHIRKESDLMQFTTICVDAMIIQIHTGRLQAKHALALSALHGIATASDANGEDMRLAAQTTLQAINE